MITHVEIWAVPAEPDEGSVACLSGTWGVRILLRIGSVYRYGRPYSPIPASVGDFPNLLFETSSPGQNMALIDSGINPIAEIRAVDGVRRPAILISSSPHKVGSLDTPWEDHFDADFGYVLYFGDARVSSADPARTIGNRTLLRLAEEHFSADPAIRARSAPLVFFQRVRREGRDKGFVMFQGFGVITSARVVSQYDRKLGLAFTNYAYDMAIFSMAAEGEQLDWDWISARRDGCLGVTEANRLAPKSWKEWVQTGNVEAVRRRVSRLAILPARDQLLPAGSELRGTLSSVYEYYQGRRHVFEALAMSVTGRTLKRSGGDWRRGWVTPPSSDGGADFVGRYDVGPTPFRVRQVVLGQAKCERPSVPTSGQHIARTVARLKRGWIGAYVTTSYFSEAVQREIIEDQYPILLVNGNQLALEVAMMADERRAPVHDLLDSVSSEYADLVKVRRPEEILLR